MHRSDVEMIFETEKEFLIKDCLISSNPVAILLGGQPAAGKSNLAVIAEEEHQNDTFLIINGDEYRIYHPEHDSLIKEVALYKNNEWDSDLIPGNVIEAARKKQLCLLSGTV